MRHPQRNPYSSWRARMRKFRVHLALALCAGAGVCGLLAWHWDALRIGLVGPLALWFGAGAFLWKASQALLGKIGLPQEQPPAQPVVPHPPSGAPGTPPWPPQPHAGPSPLPVVPSSATRGAGTSGADGEALTRAMGDAFGGTARTVWRAWIVLALVLLVPLTLGLATEGSSPFTAVTCRRAESCSARPVSSRGTAAVRSESGGRRRGRPSWTTAPASDVPPRDRGHGRRGNRASGPRCG